jgi:hypothetical protein
MPSTVPDVKDGLGDYFTAYPGLTAANGVAINTAPVAPEELTDKHVIIGDVTAPQGWRGLGAQRKEETPTATCWIASTGSGSDETAIRAVRRQAYGLLALIETALKDDPGADGTIPQPRQTTVAESALEETPVDLDGVSGRRAQIRFTISWTSHI